MFLLVSGRHVGAHTDGHQHGVSIQISINLGKKFLRVSRIRKIAVTRILARVFAYLPSFISQILDVIYWPVLIFILVYFELRDTENQQLPISAFHHTFSSEFSLGSRLQEHCTLKDWEPLQRFLFAWRRTVFAVEWFLAWIFHLQEDLVQFWATLKKMNAFRVCVTRCMLSMFWVFGALQQSGKLMPMAFKLKIIKLKVQMFVFSDNSMLDTVEIGA